MAYMHLGTTQLCNLRIKLNTTTLTSYSTMILMHYLLFITATIKNPALQGCSSTKRNVLL